jgi:hypothetical protein
MLAQVLPVGIEQVRILRRRPDTPISDVEACDGIFVRDEVVRQEVCESATPADVRRELGTSVVGIKFGEFFAEAVAEEEFPGFCFGQNLHAGILAAHFELRSLLSSHRFSSRRGGG